MIYSQSNVPYSTECALLCTNMDNCNVFQYDTPMKICSLFAKTVPTQVSCTAGYKVNSYRRYKEGCSGPGYVYDNATKQCVSFAYSLDDANGWYHQKAVCEAKNETLMIVDTMEKFLLLQDIIKSKEYIGYFVYYIGAKRINGTFRWMNGADMPLTLDYWVINSTYFAPPNDCVFVGNSYNNMNYKLGAMECSLGGEYFCEKLV